MNKRLIVFNMLVGYFRSFVSAFLGLFTVRWTLELLGSSDMGLYGVVGGVVFLFGFLTPVLQGVAARFYAFEIGKDDYTEADGRAWFNAVQATVIMVSVLLLGVTYFIGLHAIECWLQVPGGRCNAAVWSFRFLLASVFISMLAVPYLAMLIANQVIAVVSGVQLAQSILVFAAVAGMRFFGMSFMPDKVMTDGLVIYSFVLSCIAIAGAFLLVWLARKRYAACSTDISLWISKERILRIVIFVGWQLLGGLVWTLRGQFMIFFINKCLGTTFNASYSIATQVSNQAGALAASLNDAISPALSSEEGGGRRLNVMGLAKRGSLLSMALVLLFAVPLAVFIEPVLGFWLKNPPPGCGSLCVAMLVVVAIRQGAAGYGLAILAHGRLGCWQLCDAMAMLVAVPAAVLFWRMELGIASVGWALVISECIASLNRYIYARHLLKCDEQ